MGCVFFNDINTTFLPPPQGVGAKFKFASNRAAPCILKQFLSQFFFHVNALVMITVFPNGPGKIPSPSSLSFAVPVQRAICSNCLKHVFTSHLTATCFILPRSCSKRLCRFITQLLFETGPVCSSFYSLRNILM